MGPGRIKFFSYKAVSDAINDLVGCSIYFFNVKLIARDYFHICFFFFFFGSWDTYLQTSLQRLEARSSFHPFRCRYTRAKHPRAQKSVKWWRRFLFCSSRCLPEIKKLVLNILVTGTLSARHDTRTRRIIASRFGLQRPPFEYCFGSSVAAGYSWRTFGMFLASVFT